MRFRVALATMLAASAAGAAVAHHSFSAEFDPDRPVKFMGKVTEMKWSNPHAWIYLDVVGDDGKVVNWSLEMTGANGLFRRGWRKEDLPVGTVLVGLMRSRAGDHPTAEGLVIAGGLMLVPSPIAWVAAGAAWIGLAIVAIQPVRPLRRA